MLFCVIITLKQMKKIVVFASGAGTNAENIIKYFKNKSSGKVTAVFLTILLLVF